ncbi:MAG: transglutaminase-like domain-containing protein [Algoriphagus sp.]|jgi:regulator of sirC expression with transglutaminase-like and TPR domain|uniref:transglutaminase-like domain-containing protein n=1 Tax=Algoriphagus sp. TaxID=1872435 RepID=UPI00274A6B7C|nr:transglutaminase-like domain-containing protein [Algoriphagus sp.]MDP4748612.1 transglutaminase-like domain-containing protein [Algoriphagus sp.]MDP4839467.1 transglutaminase-like domain-containing protein [Algoriphagus sp.]MDP4905549.1 transglutaminase-like domain-containing protein [Algoriphagus sp.]MDP4957369.1 transglutaminase-like domain-containing protein [Algoriphagus sp.]
MLSPSQLDALISLLDDSDWEVKQHVREKLIGLGAAVIPVLEQKWEESFNPILQKELEDLVHDLQFGLVKQRLTDWKASQNQDLLDGLWILNTYQYPDLERETLKAAIHQLYVEAWTHFSPDLQPLDQVKILNHVFFKQLQFSGNTKNFHSPSNSMLSAVLESKKGNPISLCSIYLLVSQKLGLPIYGVNLPNLFVLIYQQGETNFYINAFNKGLVFSKKEIQNFLEQLKIDPLPVYFEPCTNLAIVLRFLKNLATAFEHLGESSKLGEVKELLEILAA